MAKAKQAVTEHFFHDDAGDLKENSQWEFFDGANLDAILAKCHLSSFDGKTSAFFVPDYGSVEYQPEHYYADIITLLHGYGYVTRFRWRDLEYGLEVSWNKPLVH